MLGKTRELWEQPGAQLDRERRLTRAEGHGKKVKMRMRQDEMVGTRISR